MKHTIKGQMTAVFISMIALSLILIGVINYCFLGEFYIAHKKSMITDAYREINKIADVSEDFSGTVQQMSLKNNLSILVVSEEFDVLNSTAKDTKNQLLRLFGYYNGWYHGDIEVLKQTERCVLQKSSDDVLHMQYLEMWGILDSNNYFIIRTPLESIRESVTLSNLFFVIVGLVVAVISGVVIWLFARRFTKPITELTDISRRMTNLDFEAKYTGKSANEIDVLGENFNRMSGELETTISELKTANNELQKDIEKKTQIDEVRKEFLNNVSHELKTPIALVQGYAEGLKDNISEDEESREFYCDVIIDESAKMNTMVKKLLTLNQLEFGNDQVVMERFDLVALISGVLQASDILIRQKEAEICFDAEEVVYVWGDEFKVEEVVTNYLTNALNHLNGEKKIDIRLHREAGVVRTSVFNTGEPIPEEDLEKVWIKFYKVDKARTREYGGSGIGLSIVKAIMESMNQQCGAKNYDNGVEFWFTLESK